MPHIFCEYCQSLATVYLRFHEPYTHPGSWRTLKVVHVCSLHSIEIISKDRTNVVNIGKS